MTPVIHARRTQLGRLVRYLFGPGRAEEHVDPRLVAAWNGAGDLESLEPPVRADGSRDVRRLVELLYQPLRAARNAPRLPVWHCSISNAPEDRTLSDQAWRHIAGEVMAAVGLAPHGDLDAVRWLAVRHADNHIHLVATLVRQDGRTAWGWQDKKKSRHICYELEQRYGLRRTGPMDRTGHRRPSAAEVNKARRLGRPLTARDDLRRHVRAAAVAASDEDEFFARLADAGVLVKFRYSARNPGERTGYTVAMSSHTTANGEPVWFGGGKLARDLTLPKLRQRWATPHGQPSTSAGPVRISQEARIQALTAAADAIRGAAEAITHLAADNPAAAQAVAQAASDTLTAIAHAVEGRRGGPVTRAAELFDHASREPNGHIDRATTRSADLRAMSRLVHLMGRVSGDKDTFTMLALLLDLANLADALATFRDGQQRYHQAEYARTAAATLRTATNVGGRTGPVTPTLTATDLAAEAGQLGDTAPPATTPQQSTTEGRERRTGR